jgi:hypothetical protein
VAGDADVAQAMDDALFIRGFDDLGDFADDLPCIIYYK